MPKTNNSHETFSFEKISYLHRQYKIQKNFKLLYLFNLRKKEYFLEKFSEFQK